MSREVSSLSKALKALPIGGPYIIETDQPRRAGQLVAKRAKYHRIPIQTRRIPKGIEVYRLRTSADRLNLHPERWWDTAAPRIPAPKRQRPLKPRPEHLSAVRARKLESKREFLEFLTNQFGSAWFRLHHVNHPMWTKTRRETMVAAGFLNRRLVDKARVIYEYQVAAL